LEAPAVKFMRELSGHSGLTAFSGTGVPSNAQPARTVIHFSARSQPTRAAHAL
jgi:hypothetical protein